MSEELKELVDLFGESRPIVSVCGDNLSEVLAEAKRQEEEFWSFVARERAALEQARAEVPTLLDWLGCVERYQEEGGEGMRAELFRLRRVRVRIHYRALAGGSGYYGEFVHEVRNTTEQEAIKRALKEFADEHGEKLCDGATLEIKVEEVEA